MVDIRLVATCAHIMIFSIILILGTDYLITVFYTLLIVCSIVSHRSSPKIDVCHQRIYGITSEIALILPTAITISASLKDIFLRLFKVSNATLKNAIRICLWQHLCHIITLVRLCGVRNITECSNEIEITKRTQCEHLCTHCGIVALCKLRVYLHNIFSMIQHNVATVDNAIEIAPRVVTICWQHVYCRDIIKVGIVIQFVLYQLI